LAAADGPLPEGGVEHAAVVHALQELVRGDSAAFAALPAQVFREPPAFSDVQTPGLARRWTELLPRLVERLDPAAQAACAQVLADLAAAADPSTAWDLLPDRHAAALLDREALRALDRGRVAQALAIWARLAADGVPFNQAAQAAASGLAAAAVDEQPADHPGWLLGRDPWGRVRWQRRLQSGERLLARSAGWALVAGDGPPLAIDADGQARRLPPLPEGTETLGLSGDQGWFVRRPGRGRGEAVPTTVWSIHLVSGTIDRCALPDLPIGPPLAHRTGLWWLTRQGRLLDHRGEQAAVLGEDPQPGWRMRLGEPLPVVWQGDQPLAWSSTATATAQVSELASDRDLPWQRWQHRSRAPLQDLPDQRTPTGLGPPEAPAGLPARVAIARSAGWITVTADAVDGGELWRRRWPALAEDQAPAQWATLAGGTVMVLEGDREATVLMATTGQVLGWGVAAGPIEPTPIAVWPGGLAGVALGRPDRVVTATAVLPLGEPLRWLAAAGGGAVGGGDTVIWMLPDRPRAEWLPLQAAPWPGGLLVEGAVRRYTSE
jgi:hypothetical protein